jgi:hypothetical protein
MAGTIITDVIQAASTSQLNIKNGVALTPPTISDVNNVAIGTFCRAWVNFNGTGTVAIRASFNVSSITDNGVGDYTVNFTNAMPDVNYAFVGSAKTDNNSTLVSQMAVVVQYNLLTTAVSYRINDTGTARDTTNNGIAIFR